MQNIGKIIAEKLQISDILQKYGFETGRHNRIPCPIHAGHDSNFAYTDQVFHCWTCGAKGNIIGLVAQIFNITYQQAIIKLNNDFGLNLTSEKPTYRDKLKFREMELQRVMQAEKEIQGQLIWNEAAKSRRELFELYGDENFQVEYLDRLLDRFGNNLSGLVDSELCIENLISNLKECAEK